MIEFIFPEGLYVVVPSSRIQARLLQGLLSVERFRQLQAQSICLFRLGKLLEKYLCTAFLPFVPFGFMFEYDMSAFGHDLRHCFAIAHAFWFPASDRLMFFFGFGSLPLLAVFPDSLVFLLKHLSTQAYPHLIDSLGHELLHMKAVVDQLSPRKDFPDGQHHGR